jgi:hypothetical protein
MRVLVSWKRRRLPYRTEFVRQASLARWERRSQTIPWKFEIGTQQVQVLPSQRLASRLEASLAWRWGDPRHEAETARPWAA